MPDPIAYAEPNALLRKLREHDLAGLRCPMHDQPPSVTSSKGGLVVKPCCGAMADVVRLVLGI